MDVLGGGNAGDMAGRGELRVTHEGKEVEIVGYLAKEDRLHVRIRPTDGSRDEWLIDTGLTAGANGIIGEGLTAAQIQAAVEAALT